MIGYYSAARERTVWTRAMDIALFATFFLAFPIAWLCDTAVIRRSNPVTVSGTLMNEAGRITAYVAASERQRVASPEAMPLGNFTLTVTDRIRGWPLTTSIQRLPARLDMDIVKEPKPRKDAKLAPADPYRIAIESMLVDEEELPALAAWRQTGPVEHQHWAAWVIATGAWWLVLLFTAGAGISFVRFATILARGKVGERRAQRRAEGKCLACGYDMTGLEFNEKCPECGELVW